MLRERAKTEGWRRPRRRRRWWKEGESRRRDQRRQTREREGREEGGTLDRHSRRMSSGREEMVRRRKVEAGQGWWRLEFCWFGLLGKQDFVIHLKWRELQLSDDINRSN